MDNIKNKYQLFAEDGQEADETGGEVADAGQENGSDEEFAELIGGKFKEQFSRKTQEIIDRRFKRTKELEEYVSRVSPVIDALKSRYALDDASEEELLSKLNSDETAEENDVSSEAAEKNDPKLSYLRAKVSQWYSEGESLKEQYPEFDLKKEMRESRLFSKLIAGGVPLKDAYEVVHKDDILCGAMAYTAGKVREQVVKGIEARGLRPIENGGSSQSSAVTRTDVNSLTAKDILKIIKQVENGASIAF